MSGGRLILGVGVGTLREEFDLLGAPFADRGDRADDAMRALRAALSQRAPEYAGPYYEFAGFIVDPCAQQHEVPMWVGGRTYRSLRRAVELADGWAPFGLRRAEIAAFLDRARTTDAWAARARPLEVILQNEHPLDPGAEPDRVAEQVQAPGRRGRHRAQRPLRAPLPRALSRATRRPPHHRLMVPRGPEAFKRFL